MNSFSRPFFFLSMVLIAPVSARSETGDSLPAFPGAEGFGSFTTGGRGGRVIRVTNLKTGGPGSLQAACSTSGARIVVFDTSGVIPGSVSIPHGKITIMGQTAPGAGITIKGMLTTPWDPAGQARYEDIVIRFLRVRPDAIPGVEWADGIQFTGVRRCVLDHISCSWASDETVDIYAQDITVQWCAIEESDTKGHPKGQHNYGLLSGPEGRGISIHHTLFAHHLRRCPAICEGPADIRNNVVYNFRDGLCHEGYTPTEGLNIIGNYYKTGPSDPNIYPFNFISGVYYYLRDNYFEDITTGLDEVIDDPWADADLLPGLKRYSNRGKKAEQEFEAPPVTTQDPAEAYELVLERAGCFPRDTVSRRTVEEVRNGTGSWGRHDSGDLLAGLVVGTHPGDSDKDGMADVWERANGLDTSDGTDHSTVMESGYTAIEEYCNMLAQRLIETRGRPPEKIYDFNSDGELNIADAIALILLAKENQDELRFDTNGDGVWTIIDVVKLIIIILGS